MEEKLDEILNNLVSDDVADIVLGEPQSLEEARRNADTKKEINGLVLRAKHQILELIKQERVNTLYNFKVDYIKQSLEPGGIGIMAYFEKRLAQLTELQEGNNNENSNSL